MLGLAFIPKEKVQEVFVEIKAKFNVSAATMSSYEELWSFLNYFQREWLDDLDKWNLSGLPRNRTNNRAEGYNK